MMKRVILYFLLCGGLFQQISCPASCSGGQVIVVANSIDSALNTDFVESLKPEWDVLLVHPSEYEPYKTNTYVVVLGGSKAPEGTGEIVESILQESGTARDMQVNLNVWQPGQVVVVLSGADRETTRTACETNKTCVMSLFKGVESVLQTAKPDHPLAVFLWPVPLSRTSTLSPYAPSPLPEGVKRLPSIIPYQLEEDTWFFWIDDAPCAKYAHPTRFFLFGIETGRFTVHNEEWWPVLNGTPLWIEPSQYWDRTFWVSNTGIEPPVSHFRSVLKSTKIQVTRLREPVKELEECTARALIVNGWNPGQPLQHDMDEDQHTLKETLTSMHVAAESAATATEIHDVLQRWSQEMNQYETLILYMTAHGGRGYFLLKEDVFKINELIVLLTMFDKKIHIHIIMDVPYSGSLIYPLKNTAEVVITAAGEVTPAYGDWDPDCDINPGDRGSEFTSGLVVSMKELARTRSKVEEWKKLASETHASWYTYLLEEAFKTAQELDAACAAGYTSPMIWVDELDTVPGQPEKKSGCSCGH
jgi:hypothetical protein